MKRKIHETFSYSKTHIPYKTALINNSQSIVLKACEQPVNEATDSTVD
jgi:hypothetical protein